MIPVRAKIKKLRIYILVLVQCSAIGLPLSSTVLAQEAPAGEVITEPVPTTPTETAPVEPPPELPRPTGSAAHTYAYNGETGLWENDYYTWDPSTRVTTPRYTPEHSFNNSSNLWEVREWVYVASEGTYRFRVTRTYPPATPAPATEAIPETSGNQPVSATNETAASTEVGPAPETAQVVAVAAQPPLGDLSVITYNTAGHATYNGNLDVSVTNNLDSSAVSGDASVLQNTVAGSATSGDAMAMANILNMVQSVWGYEGMVPNLYTATLQGDYFGDIVIDPSLFNGISQYQANLEGELDVNISSDIGIENNVDLLAQSGDATVSKNTLAGDATSGNADALANIINMISTSISAGESFLGILNVNGNLEGDVLLAEDVLDELIAANVPTEQIAIGSDINMLFDLDDSQSISNQVTATAGTGNASAAYNTIAGDATSGNAQTNVTVFNLTGRQVVGMNALLVFVNVAGEWIGFITDAPAGATAAALGGGLTENTYQTVMTELDADINADTNAVIENNVNVTALSGDANVSYNTTAGNAKSGDATAGVNISNMINNSFSMAGWFGMLFINVLGDWFGSFGTNTSFGNAPVIPSVVTTATPQNNPAASGSSTNTSAAPPAPRVRVFTASFAEDGQGGTVLANAADITPPPASSAEAGPAGADGTAIASYDFTTLLLLGAVGMAFTIIFYGDRLTSLIRRY